MLTFTRGAIGPARIFSQIYPALKYCFLLGFLFALLWWTIKHTGATIRAKLKQTLPSAIYTPLNIVLFTPMSYLRNVHPSLVFNGMLQWAPLNLTYFTSGLYLSVGFMYYLKRYKTVSFAFTIELAIDDVLISFRLGGKNTTTSSQQPFPEPSPSQPSSSSSLFSITLSRSTGGVTTCLELVLMVAVVRLLCCLTCLLRDTLDLIRGFKRGMYVGKLGTLRRRFRVWI